METSERDPITKSVTLSAYSHSPIHICVIQNDLTVLRRHLSSLPRLSPPSTILTAVAAERENLIADKISAVLDRRDVPGGETPLHLAVRLHRPSIASALVAAGADPSLQNTAGWNPFQDSLLLRRPRSLSLMLLRHHRLSSVLKWRRRIPAVLAAVRRVRDFYMEINFKFESSVIPPFVLAKALPSDTYKIWKQGEKIRVDTSLAGFDGLRVLRSNRTFLFLGDDDELDPGTLLEVNHDKNSIGDLLEDMGMGIGEDEEESLVGAEAAAKVFRPGVDVTRAELVGRTNWRRKEKVEMVGEWKTRVFEIHNVFFCIKTRKAVSSDPMPDLIIDDDGDEGFLVAELPPRPSSASTNPRHSCVELSRPQRRELLGKKLNDGAVDVSVPPRHSCYELSRPQRRDSEKSKKNSDDGSIEWDFVRVDEDVTPSLSAMAPPRHSCYEPRWRRDGQLNEKGGGGLIELDFDVAQEEKVRMSVDVRQNGFKASDKMDNGGNWYGGGFGKLGKEKELKKSLRPTVWLTEDFPLKTEEVIPLLDVIANKVKAARRLRELLTTKFPTGTFPVKVAIPVIPSVRVVVTFTKFAELPPTEQFFTPPSSPKEFVEDDDHKKSVNGLKSSWLRWGNNNTRISHSKSVSPSPSRHGTDPFVIPNNYTWVNASSRNPKKPKSKKETPTTTTTASLADKHSGLCSIKA